MNGSAAKVHHFPGFDGVKTPVVLSGLPGTEDGASWKASEVDHLFLVEYSMDEFEHVLSKQTSGWRIDTVVLPAGTYPWRVKVLPNMPEDVEEDDEPEMDGEWFIGDEIVSDNDPGSPEIVRSDVDGNTDLFFAAPVGVWESGYAAQHVGSLGGWTGMNELIFLTGKVGSGISSSGPRT